MTLIKSHSCQLILLVYYLLQEAKIKNNNNNNCPKKIISLYLSEENYLGIHIMLELAWSTENYSFFASIFCHYLVLGRNNEWKGLRRLGEHRNKREGKDKLGFPGLGSPISIVYLWGLAAETDRHPSLE